MANPYCGAVEGGECSCAASFVSGSNRAGESPDKRGFRRIDPVKIGKTTRCLQISLRLLTDRPLKVSAYSPRGWRSSRPPTLISGYKTYAAYFSITQTIV